MTAKFREPFAKRLAHIRKARGFTQREIAKKVGVSQRVIALYETVIKNPTPDLIVRLAHALKVSVDELMGSKPFKEKGDSLKTRKLLRKMKTLEQLPEKEQKKVINYINDLAAKYNTNNH